MAAEYEGKLSEEWHNVEEEKQKIEALEMELEGARNDFRVSTTSASFVYSTYICPKPLLTDTIEMYSTVSEHPE